MPGLCVMRVVAAARFELTFGPPVPKFRDGPENVSPTSALLALLVDRKNRKAEHDARPSLYEDGCGGWI